MSTRLDLYLQWSVGDTYVNTPEEQGLVTKFQALYNVTKSAQEQKTEVNPANLTKWRKAYYGVLNALNQDGTESKRKSRSVRKLCYEFIESKIDNTVPLPKMTPRYKWDLPLVDITERYLKFEMDRTLSRQENDSNERSTYIDGTTWLKVWWDSLDTSWSRSGRVKMESLQVDQFFPQPGVKDYKQLEWGFERRQLSLTRIYDLYGRKCQPINQGSNVVNVISCYYLNENRIVGHFMWSETSLQVICNEKDWQIRKLRTCKKCGAVEPQALVCGVCGSKSFKYENADVDILEEDLLEIYNPYEVGETNDKKEQDRYDARIFATAGTELPFYKIRQLPFVPRPAIRSLDDIYGTSEVSILLEEQDASNKLLTKALDKTMKSGAVVTEPEKMKIGDTDESYKRLKVRTPEEAAMVQVKQIVADTQYDIVLANLIYDSARNTTGVTQSFQGARDSTAVSGKAKEISAMQSAGRIESLRVMKSTAFAGVYELMLKYLLAFSDEDRIFLSILPDGTSKEESWNKYMFLDKDKNGVIYYRDDFSFNTDPAATLSQNRSFMWQETQDKFLTGAFGNPSDPRVLKTFWTVMDGFQYPLAKLALAGIEQNEQHLPPEVEQALLANPELLQQIMSTLQGGGHGGARAGAGAPASGFQRPALVEKTNEKNRAANKQTHLPAQAQATLQAGER